MERLSVVATMALAVSLVACGGGLSNTTRAKPAQGEWSANLANSSAQPLGSFSFEMMQNNTVLTGTNMNFANMGSLAQCFGAGTVINGQMRPGMMNSQSVTMTMSWIDPQGAGTNTMTMQGNMGMGMGSASGTFTLTGQTPGCIDQTGTFTMTHISSTM